MARLEISTQYSQNKKPLHLTQRRKGSAVPLCLVVYDDGPEGARTLDLYNAIVALSQLSYRPKTVYDCIQFMEIVNFLFAQPSTQNV